ncbi:hypothetical protein [Pectobacterium parvum]|uniref:hypothetical protein n=1 Tax=Pectobacterium parvum TaxID=2778550 RepID=UPI000907B415
MSVKNRARDRLPNGRIKSYRRVGAKFASCARAFDKSPGWFRNLMCTRPERRVVRKLLKSGADPDVIVFPARKRAAVYWW